MRRGTPTMAMVTAALALAIVVQPAQAGGRRINSSYYLYNVRLHTGNFKSQLAKTSFGLVALGFNSSTLNVYNFVTDGVMAIPETEGGLANGDLLLGLNPAFFTNIQTSDFYYTHLAAVLDTLGTQTTFTFEYSGLPQGLEYDDTFAFSMLNAAEGPLFPTSDPLGAGALFVASIDGNPGPTLEIYDPAVLVPGGLNPDTIVVNQGIVTIGVEQDGLPRALGFRRVFPNPMAGRTTIEFDVPTALGPVELGVFDVQGRRQTRLNKTPIGPGSHSLIWDGRDSAGRLLAPGVYLLRLQTGNRVAVVHKLVLNR